MNALHKAVDTLLKLSDYPMALEVADEFVRRAPTRILNAHYLRGEAFEDNGDYNRALADYADTIELFNDKTKVSLRVFQHMAEILRQARPPVRGDEPDPHLDGARPGDARHQQDAQDRRRLRAAGQLRDDNGLSEGALPAARRHTRRAGEGRDQRRARHLHHRHRRKLCVGAGAFAERAKISTAGARDITLSTANGRAKGKLTQADAVGLGRLKASHVPVVVQDVDEKSYGRASTGCSA